MSWLCDALWALLAWCAGLLFAPGLDAYAAGWRH